MLPPVLPVERAGAGEGCPCFAYATGDRLALVRILRRAARKGKVGNFPGQVAVEGSEGRSDSTLKDETGRENHS